MKYSLVACLMLCFSLSFAQLSVQNDAYVFVDDQVLFVTDYVNIDDANSNIYLRNEAQLLQDPTATNSTNSGSGSLSLYQSGTVDQFAYNYWCSPVGNSSATFGNEDGRVALLNDAMSLTLFTPATFTTGYDGSTSPLIISSRWLWTYQTSSLYSDWVFVGDTGPIDPGLGFTMKGNPSGNQLYDFRGKPNNGTITNPVLNGDFTLVGNPYPSAMDSAAFIHDSDNSSEITGTLFYWEQDASVGSHVLADYIGGYHEFTIDAAGVIISNTFAQFETYDSAGNSTGVPPGPPGGTKQARRYIPIGQGFMVEGLPGITNTVTTKNSHRVYEKEGTNSFFFRNNNSENDGIDSQNAGIQYQENGLSIVPSDYKRFRLNIDFSVDEGEYTRQLLLNFHDNATMSYDRGLEIHRSDNLDSDAYFLQEEDIFSGLAYPLTQALTIPLVVDIAVQQPLRFRIFDIQNFDESQGIYIHDIENDLYVNLRDQNYDLNIEPGNYTDRFEIVFTNQALSIGEFDKNTLIINQNNGIHQLSVLNPNSIDVKSIVVYDVAGKRLIQSQYNTILSTYEVSTTNLSDGVYVVNVLSDNNNTIKSQKIIVKN